MRHIVLPGRLKHLWISAGLPGLALRLGLQMHMIRHDLHFQDLAPRLRAYFFNPVSGQGRKIHSDNQEKPAIGGPWEWSISTQNDRANRRFEKWTVHQ